MRKEYKNSVSKHRHNKKKFHQFRYNELKNEKKREVINYNFFIT